MAQEIDSDWITTAEAATLTRYTVDYLRGLLRVGVIKGRKWASDWQVSRTSLRAYLENQTARGKRRGRKPAGS